MPTFPGIGENTHSFPISTSSSLQQTAQDGHGEVRERPHASSQSPSREERSRAASTERDRFAANFRTHRPEGTPPTRENTPFHSFQSWAEHARDKIVGRYGAEVFRQLPMDEEGGLVDGEKILGLLFDIVYGLYANKAVSEDRLGPEQQDQFIRDLATIGEGGDYRVGAQGLNAGDPLDGLPPLDALAYDSDEAKNCHFRVQLTSLTPEAVAGPDDTSSRLTLTLPPGDVAAAAKSLAPLLSEFKDIFFQLKVMAPAEQGTRPDGINLHLNQENRKRAEELGNRIREKLPVAVILPQRPDGMDTLRGHDVDIPYAEFSEHAVSRSYGADRAHIIVEAVLRNLIYGTDLKEALQDVLEERGYSRDNPALIARGQAS